jgi:hypothetical protein
MVAVGAAVGVRTRAASPTVAFYPRREENKT